MDVFPVLYTFIYMKYRAVISDVDGTIIAPGVAGVSGLSPRLVKAVHEVQNRGIWISLATARSWDWVHDVAGSLELRAPVILDNGARIWDCGAKKYIRELYIPKKTAQEVLSFLVGSGHPVHLVDNNTRQLFNPNQPPALESVVKIMVLHIHPNDTHLLSEKLQSFSNIQITKSISGPGVESIHVTNKDATKESALAEIADYLHIRRDECIGIGDSYNDVGFMKQCGLKVAVGNAVDEVKAIADLVIDAYTDDGVAKFLETQFLQTISQ